MTTLSASAPAAPHGTRSIDLALWAAYLGAGAAAGVAGGLLARVAMRGVALIQGQTPAFTLFGTLGIAMIFLLPGVLVGLGALALVAWRGRSRRAAFGWLALILTLLLLGPLYAVATGDLPNTSPRRIASLMAIFVPVPVAMAWMAVYVAAPLHRRAARSGAKTLPLGWALALLLLAGMAFVAGIGALSGAQRHPRIVNTLVNMQSVDFTGAADQLRSIGLLLFMVYMSLVCWAIWRQPQSAGVRRGAAAALAAFWLLLAGGAPLPAQSAWVQGALTALGLAALLVVFLQAGGFTPPRRLLFVCAVAWAAVALWLVAGQPTGSTAWLAWGIVALALSTILIVRRQQRAGAHAARISSLLLAAFALLWLGLWAAAMLHPSLRLVGMSPLGVTLTVKLFWLPWLLLPAALLPAALLPASPSGE